MKSKTAHGSRRLVVLISVTLVALLAINATPGVTYQVLHSFPIGPQYPHASVIQGNDGNFYGTSYGGGIFDYGTVYRMTPAGELTTLIEFNGANGAHPIGGLIMGTDGNFYGTTSS